MGTPGKLKKNQFGYCLPVDAPLIFVHYETINYLMNNDVAGSTVNPTLELRLGDVGFTG